MIRCVMFEIINSLMIFKIVCRLYIVQHLTYIALSSPVFFTSVLSEAIVYRTGNERLEHSMARQNYNYSICT